MAQWDPGPKGAHTVEIQCKIETERAMNSEANLLFENTETSSEKLVKPEMYCLSGGVNGREACWVSPQTEQSDSLGCAHL